MFSLRDVWESQGPWTICFIQFSATPTPKLTPTPDPSPTIVPNTVLLSYLPGTLWPFRKHLGSSPGSLVGVMLSPVTGLEGPSLASPSLAALGSASLSDRDERVSMLAKSHSHVKFKTTA